MNLENAAIVGLSAALVGLVVYSAIKLYRQGQPQPVKYGGNVFADRETALMFRDQERVFQAY